MFSDVENIFGISLGNHLESCREDVLRFEKLFHKIDAKYLCLFNCNPQKEIEIFIQDKQLCEKDLLIIHYSGHGKLIGKTINGKMEMISTWLCNDNKTYNFSDDIDHVLSKLPCKILLISDSCHSGRFGDFYTGKNMTFIGSSSITNQSKEYLLEGRTKCGILINILEYTLERILFHEITFSSMEEFIREFCKKHRIKIRPILKSFL